MEKTPPKRSRSLRTWGLRVASLLLGVGFVCWMSWQIGFDPYQWWTKRQIAARASTAAKAPIHLSSKPIGITPPVPMGNDSSISPVPLQLMLVSVHPGRNAAEGTADIGVVRESPQTYQAGAMLENGARLAEIHSDFVLLRKGSHSARLYLENAHASGNTGDKAIWVVGGSKEVPSIAPVTSREVLTDYIRPSPIFDGDTMVGYQLYPGANKAPFSQMGLQPGDVLVEIGGVQLTDPAQAWELLEQLKDGASLSGAVRRNGSVAHVTLDGGLITRTEEERQRPPQAMLAPGN